MLTTTNNEVINLGKVKQGEVVTKQFQVRNSSGEFIQITGISASCGCTVPEIKEKKIAPKQTTTVTFTFNSDNKKGMHIKSVKINYSFHGEQHVLIQKFMVDIL